MTAICGITPAGAGKTMDDLTAAWAARDHPRRCGENSSSDMRAVITCRITPAGAGKTVSSSAACLRGRDHPRRCGENYLIFWPQERLQGSPPQVRGKLTCPRYSVKFSRITPAGAGKTTAIRIVRMCNKDHPRRCGENPI